MFPLPKGPKYPNIGCLGFLYEESELCLGVDTFYPGTRTRRECVGTSSYYAFVGWAGACQEKARPGSEEYRKEPLKWCSVYGTYSSRCADTVMQIDLWMNPAWKLVTRPEAGKRGMWPPADIISSVAHRSHCDMPKIELWL